MDLELNTYPAHPILVADDEKHAVASLQITLKTAGINHTIACLDGLGILPLMEKHEVELVLLDIVMPHISGEEILCEIRQKYPETPVIMITGIDEVGTAVRCMQEGAFDYIVKPVESDRLVGAVKKAMKIRELSRENLALSRKFNSEDLEKPKKFSKFITRNRKILKLFQYCEAIAESRQPVLITGETGVGKELVAEIVHDLSGLRGKFVSVNVAGLDDNVFSDTLFGHEKGAFTGADRPRTGLIRKAEGGTLFLDEIGDLSEMSQIKLLRLFEKNECYALGSDIPLKTNVRFLAATNKDPDQLVQTGRYRSDLFYRLNTHRIHLPPLRERSDDIPLLFNHFLQQTAQALSVKKPDFGHDTLTQLARYHFPGNVRELKSMVFDTVSRTKSGNLSFESFNLPIPENTSPSIAEFLSLIGRLDCFPSLRESNLILIREAMKRSGNSQKLAAKLLGITPQALNQRLKRMNE